MHSVYSDEQISDDFLWNTITKHHKWKSSWITLNTKKSIRALTNTTSLLNASWLTFYLAMLQLPLLLPLSVDTSPPELKLLSKILGTFEKQLFLMLKNLRSWRIMGLWYFELRIQIQKWLIYSHFPRFQSLNLYLLSQQNLLILQCFVPCQIPLDFHFI